MPKRRVFHIIYAKKIMNGLIKTLVICTAYLLCINSASALADTVGVFSNLEGEITYITGSVFLTSTTIKYTATTKKGKVTLREQSQAEIKWMQVYGRVFFRLPRKSKGKDFRLMEVLAITKDHMLVQFWYDWYHYFIFDHQGNMIMEETKVYDRGQTIGAEKNNRQVLDKLKPYFKDCPELINAMQANLDNNNILSDGITLIQCEKAISVRDILQVLENKKWR